MTLHQVYALAVTAGLLAVVPAWSQAYVNPTKQADGKDGGLKHMRMPGLFGPSSVRLKVGDVAPAIVLPRVLHAPGSAPWSSSSMANVTTVIVFFPDTSHNPERVSDWNALVKEFENKLVQFVWVTGESERTLLPSLKSHPVSGWVFYDPGGAIGQSYGLDMPVMVAVGRDQRIVGFSRAQIANQSTMNAILEGRIRTEPVKREELQAFLASGKVLMDAEPFKMSDPEDYRPPFAPSKTLHVSASRTEEIGNYGSDDYWSRKGYTLKRLLAEIYDVESARLSIPPELDDEKRYDFALVVPSPLDQEGMRALARQGVENYFHVFSTREKRVTAVYVVTTAGGTPPKAKTMPMRRGAFTSSRSTFLTMRSVGGGGTPELASGTLSELRNVSMMDGTMETFCRSLESILDRPVVDETELKGSYKLTMESYPDSRNADDNNDFPERLREQLHLAIVPTERRVETLAFYPRGND